MVTIRNTGKLRVIPKEARRVGIYFYCDSELILVVARKRTHSFRIAVTPDLRIKFHKWLESDPMTVEELVELFEKLRMKFELVEGSKK